MTEVDMIVNYIGFKDSLQNLNKRFSSTLFKLQFIILLPCSGLLKVEILSSCYSCTVPVLGSHTKVSVLYWSCPGVRLWLPVLYWSCPGVTSWVLVLCWSCPGVRQSLLVLSWSGPGDSCKQFGEDWHQLIGTSDKIWNLIYCKFTIKQNYCTIKRIFKKIKVRKL